MLGVFDNSVNLRGGQADGEKEGFESREEKFVVHPLQLTDCQKVFVCVLPGHRGEEGGCGGRMRNKSGKT